MRFLFGQGWMIAWHLAFYGMLLIGVVLPMLAFLPLKRAGQAPDTPSLGSFGVVMMIVCALALITFVDCAVLGFAARGPWWHKVVFAIGTATVVAVVSYRLSVMLADKQNLFAMLAVAGWAVAVAAANLVVLNIARIRPDSLSLHLTWPILVLFVLLSAPVAIAVLLVPLGLLLERFQR